MKQRLAALATVALLAACGDAPTQPSALTAPAPSFSVTAAAPTITNGSFENDLAGWTYPGTPGQFVDVGALWQAADGSKSVDLNGFAPGWVSQDIATVPGGIYTVSFALAGNPGWPQNVKELQVSAAGESATYEFDTTGKSGTNMGWTQQSFGFTATDATTTLTFKSLHAGSPYIWQDRAQGPALDNVRVAFANPTTMDQCKDGGWEHYGFRNQGQCVRYVETGKDSR